jgi:hypothetical protein
LSRAASRTFYETGDTRVFDEHTPNCAIFRFEKGRMDRQMADGRRFVEVDGQLMFLRDDYSVRFADLFTVKVGAVSGADQIFTHPKGNMEFVCSKTVETGETRRMLYGIKHPHLEKHKEPNCSPAASSLSTKATGGNGAALFRSTCTRASTSMAGRASLNPSSCTTAQLRRRRSGAVHQKPAHAAPRPDRVHDAAEQGS